MGRRACTPPNAPGEARATSPRFYSRWPLGALVPAAPCAHDAAWLFARTGKLVGAVGGAGGPKTAQAATSETPAPSPGV